MYQKRTAISTRTRAPADAFDHVPENAWQEPARNRTLTLSELLPLSSFRFQSTSVTVPRVPTLQPPSEEVTSTVRTRVVFGVAGRALGVRRSTLQSETRDAKVFSRALPRTTARKSPVFRTLPEPFDVDRGPAAAEKL